MAVLVNGLRFYTPPGTLPITIASIVGLLLYFGSGGSRSDYLPSFIGIFGGPLLIYFSIKWIRYAFSDSKEQKYKESDEYKREMSEYQKANSRWDNSYYCRRHDLIFSTIGADSCSPTEFRQSLYK